MVSGKAQDQHEPGGTVDDNPEFQVMPTSRRTAAVDDLILRDGERTRLIFRPLIVDNPNNRDACVRGGFRYQKKSPKNTWDDCDTRSLVELKAGDGGFKLELHAGEVKTLRDGLDRFCAVYAQEGIPAWSETYTVVQGQMGDLMRSILERKDDLESLGPDATEVLELLIEVLTRTEQPLTIAKVLSGSGAEALAKLNAASQLAQLDAVLQAWESNLDNADEAWWQKQFVENAWIMPQVFGQPFVLLQDQAYMGGKRLDNTGGHVLDLLLRNALTDNVALVEIKTPVTPLLGTKVRSGIWSFSPALSGSVTQLLSYKDDLQKEYYTRAGQSRRAGADHFEVFNPKCVLLIGCTGSEFDGDNEKLRSLELARNDFRTVEIVTYDEMLLRLRLLLSVLTESLPDDVPAPADFADDIPF
jgi:hypothetical protein